MFESPTGSSQRSSSARRVCLMRFAPLNPDASPRRTGKSTVGHEFHAGCVRERKATFSLRHVCLDPQCGGAAPAQDSCPRLQLRPSTRAAASSRFCTATASSARLPAGRSYDSVLCVVLYKQARTLPVHIRVSFAANCVALRLLVVLKTSFEDHDGGGGERRAGQIVAKRF